MKLYCAVVTGVACILLGGCQEPLAQEGGDGSLDVELVQTLNNIGVENAIIAQHTLYPYHFVPGGDRLNDLGRRDLGVLAGHFKEYPGTLNVRRGDTAPELYEARIAHVMSRLKSAGVEASRISLADGMPGGDGMTAEKVVTVLSAPSELGAASAEGGTGTTTR